MQVFNAKRLAKNQAFFREVNERIDEVASRLGDDDHLYEYVCECSDPACSERIALTRQAYEHVRGDGTRFVISPGHATNQIEAVVGRESEYVVVEKVGTAADVAVERDPRSS